MPNASGKYTLNSFQEFLRHQGRRGSVLQCHYPQSCCVSVCPSSLWKAALCFIQTQINLKSIYLLWQNLYFLIFNLTQVRPVLCVFLKSEASILKPNISTFFLCLCASICALCICVLCLLGWSPRCPTVQFHLQHSSLSWISFSHSTSHTYRFVHFPSCKTDISSSYITHIKWGMWQGQMRRRRKMRALFTTYLSYLDEL